MFGEPTLVCLMCWNVSAVKRLDRKGRPYITCLSCGTKIFTRMGDAALIGYAKAVDFLTADKALFAQRQQEVVRARAQFDVTQEQKLTSQPPAVQQPARTEVESADPR